VRAHHEPSVVEAIEKGVYSSSSAQMIAAWVKLILPAPVALCRCAYPSSQAGRQAPAVRWRRHFIPKSVRRCHRLDVVTVDAHRREPRNRSRLSVSVVADPAQRTDRLAGVATISRKRAAAPRVGAAVEESISTVMRRAMLLPA